MPIYTRAILVKLDCESPQEADDAAFAIIETIVDKELNLNGCENESADLAEWNGRTDNGQRVAYYPADPEIDDIEPANTYPSDLDTLGKYY